MDASNAGVEEDVAPPSVMDRVSWPLD